MRSVVWFDADGDPLALRPLGDVKVAGLPPIRHSEIAVPLQPGARWQQVDHGPREVAVPLALYGSTLEENETLVDAVALAFDPTRGDGILRVVRHSGVERNLNCRFVQGLQINEAKAYDAAWKALCVFRAVDPYWYDSTEQMFEFAPGTAPTFFPIFPLVLGASEASTSGTVTNDGHVAAWPVWEIYGPGNLTATNVTTGETFDLDYLIDDGDTVTIDTRPGVKTVTSLADGDLFSFLTDDSSLWSLAKGDNEISLTMAAADDETRVVMRWARRWLTA